MASAHENGHDVTAIEQRQRLDQQRLALPAGDAAGEENDAVAFGDAPGLGEFVEAFAGDAGGIEGGGIGAAMHGPQPVGADAVIGGDAAGDEVADGDDALAAGHHRVVGALAGEVLGIDAMPGGHEGDFRAAGGEQGRPGGGAGAGVDEVDPLAFNGALKAARVDKNVERVLGEQRKLDVASTRAFDGGDQAAAGTGNEGHAAGLADRAGHLDRAALDAAGIEGR